MAAETDRNPSISALLVEDDAEILELQSSIIAARFPDIMLYTAANGRSGLELFKTHTPDIVITDINMAEMCGLQMSENIRSLKPDTKLIAITGKSEMFTMKNSGENPFEFDHIIIKPVDLSELFSVIEKCMDSIRNYPS